MWLCFGASKSECVVCVCVCACVCVCVRVRVILCACSSLCACPCVCVLVCTPHAQRGADVSGSLWLWLTVSTLQVHVPLPGAEAREAMLRKRLPVDQCSDIDYAAIAARTQGFSGSDITLLCKETAMRPLRRLMDELETAEGAAASKRAHCLPHTGASIACSRS